jgi:hypothetical protein
MAILALGLLLALSGAPLSAQDQVAERPLLMPGKKAIYQRVLTEAVAYWYDDAGGKAMSPIMPLTLLYVYFKKDIDGVTWLRCSANTVGERVGWIRADQTIEFKQALVLRFADRANRRPILFFKSYDDLMAVASSPDIPGEIARLEKQYTAFEKTGAAAPADFPLVGIESTDAQGAVDNQNFYLVPIFTYDDATFESVKLLEVASIIPGSGPKTAMGPEEGDPLLASAELGQLSRSFAPSGYFASSGMRGFLSPVVSDASPPPYGGSGKAPLLAKLSAPPEPVSLVAANFVPPTPPPTRRTTQTTVDKKKFGIAILVDTSISMRPFIDQCRYISQELFDRIEEEGLSDRVYLGIVAYRSSTRARPGLEFTTRVISDLEPGTNRRQFRRALERMDEARVSSHHFSEDSMAGLDTAISELGWEKDFVAKYILMITDAGPLPQNDPFNSTLHSPSSMGSWLEEEMIDLIVIHIKSRAGRRNHEMAENAYLRVVSSADRYIDVATDYYNRGALAFSGVAGEVIDYLVDSIKATEDFVQNEGLADAAIGDALNSGPSTLVATETGSLGGDVAPTGQLPYKPEVGQPAFGLPGQGVPPVGFGGSQQGQAFPGPGGQGFPGSGGQAFPGPSGGGAKEAADGPSGVEKGAGAFGGPSGGAAPGFGGPSGGTSGVAPGGSSLAEGGSRPAKRPLLERPVLKGVPTDEAGLNDNPNAETHRAPTGDDLVDQATREGAKVGAALGYSVALRYLGNIKKTEAPVMVKSWIADKDLSRLASASSEEVPSVQVAVLMTKNQLSTLSKQLQVILTKAEESIDTQSGDFFQSILTASAAITNDPNQFANNPNAALSDLGGLTELLEGLPYKSLIMGLTERDWYNMSAYEQDSFVRTIRSLLKNYELYDASQDWAKYSESYEGDWLYRVPLTSLP